MLIFGCLEETVFVLAWQILIFGEGFLIADVWSEYRETLRFAAPTCAQAKRGSAVNSQQEQARLVTQRHSRVILALIAHKQRKLGRVYV